MKFQKSCDPILGASICLGRSLLQTLALVYWSPPFRRKAKGHSIRLSVVTWYMVTWFCGSVPPPSNSRYLVCTTHPTVLCRCF